MAELRLNNVNKTYESKIKAVENFNLHVQDGEFIVFIGPSGCGKSTTLRMIAGLEEITEGELFIDNKKVNDIPAKDRDIAMVFQNYALYPHMTVYDNLAFGLKQRKVKKKEIHNRVIQVVKILELEDYLNRKPNSLSGGQRQRVALGRAIVRNPEVFLMDEPLSNLDAKLRAQMRAEISKLHQKLQTTTIYVTHDQTEAMTMATRLVVLKDGKIQQIGTPKEVYNKPINIFVGGFIGSPAMNFFKGTYLGNRITIEGYDFELPENQLNTVPKNIKNVIIGLRPEDIYITPTIEKVERKNTCTVTIEFPELLGAETLLNSSLGDQCFLARVKTEQDFHVNQQVKLTFDINKFHFFDPETEQRFIR